MPYTKLLVHLIWSTRNGQKLISGQLRSGLISHIKEESLSKGIFIDTINCVADHIHILISLQPDQTLNKVIQLIKNDSSNWINKNKLIHDKFEWQKSYMALSVSESNLNKVRKYIENQEQHHIKKSFRSEVNLLIEKSIYKRNSEGVAPAPVFIPD